MSGICCYMDLHPGRNVYLTSCFILSVLFLTGGEHLWSLHVALDPLSHRISTLIGCLDFTCLPDVNHLEGQLPW